MAKNRFGLSRDIPSDVRRRVRRRCGFGCVVCGSAIITYEHFDPPFRDAKKHQAEGITLLCGSHQLESSKGLLSRESIARFNVHPCCLQRGYASHPLDLGSRRPRVLMGGTNFTNCGTGIAFNGQWMFRVREPEPHSRRWRLSAVFPSPDGNLACVIRNNELFLPAENFEIEQVARSIFVRRDRDVVLELEFVPPDTLSIIRYVISVPEGRIFVGRRSLKNPLSGVEETRNVLEFQNHSGGTQTFVDCAFSSDVGLNLCLENNGMVLRSMTI